MQAKPRRLPPLPTWTLLAGAWSWSGSEEMGTPIPWVGASCADWIRAWTFTPMFLRPL